MTNLRVTAGRVTRIQRPNDKETAMVTKKKAIPYGSIRKSTKKKAKKKAVEKVVKKKVKKKAAKKKK